MSKDKEKVSIDQSNDPNIVDLAIGELCSNSIKNRILKINNARVGKKVIVNENLIFISDGEYVLNLTSESPDFDRYLNLIRDEGFDLSKFFQFIFDENTHKEKFEELMETFFERVGKDFFYKKIKLCDNVVKLFSYFYKNGLDFVPILNFLENCSQNPSDISIDEFFLFFKSWNLPITHDGHILAFKYVNSNYTSVHDGETKNNIGTWVEMDRDLVDSDRNKTCSSGLHFCSFGYLRGLKGDCRIVVVKVNPKDIVSVPSDYNNMKVRCCKYYILCDYNEDEDRLSGNFYVEDGIEKSGFDMSKFDEAEFAYHLNKMTELYCRDSLLQEIKNKFSNT